MRAGGLVKAERLRENFLQVIILLKKKECHHILSVID